MLFVACASGNAKKKQEVARAAAVLAVDPNVIKLEGTAGNEFMAADSDNEAVVRLRISTVDQISDERPEVSIVLAIDTSGSMRGEAIKSARLAAERVVKELRDGDRLGVVTFNSRGTVVVQSTEISALSRAKLTAQVGKIEATGTTNMAAGIGLALAELVKPGRNPKAVNRMILLSDGVPNNPASIQGLINQARGAKIPVTALGFGLDYDESLLTRIATGTGGSFTFIEEPAQVAEVFANEVLRLQKVVARNMHLTLMPGPGFAVVEVFGSDIGRTGQVASVALGDHSLGEVRDVIVRLRGVARRDGATVELLDSTLSFENALGAGGRFERNVFSSMLATNDAAKIAGGRNADVELSAARAEAAAVTVTAIAMARSGNLDNARALLVAAEKKARERASEFNNDAELLRLADSMIELGKALPSFVGQIVVPTGQPAPVVPGAAMPEAPATVRRAHSEAIKTLQGR